MLSWLAVTLASRPRSARAVPPPVRLVGLHFLPTRLAISVGLGDLFWPADRARLRSGFATRVQVAVTALRVEGGREVVVARTWRRAEIVYDVWDERLRVRVTSPDDEAHEPEVAADEREAIERVTQLVRFPVAERALLRAGSPHRLYVRGDLNPLSQELVADVRRSLSRPAPSGRLAPGESAFGSVLRFFVNPRVEASDRTVEFMSQGFVA